MEHVARTGLKQFLLSVERRLKKRLQVARTGLFCAGYISRTFYVQQMKKSNTCSVERRLKKEPNRTLKLLRTLHYCVQVARTGLKAVPCCLLRKN